MPWAHFLRLEPLFCAKTTSEAFPVCLFVNEALRLKLMIIDQASVRIIVLFIIHYVQSLSKLELALDLNGGSPCVFLLFQP